MPVSPSSSLSAVVQVAGTGTTVTQHQGLSFAAEGLSTGNVDEHLFLSEPFFGAKYDTLPNPSTAFLLCWCTLVTTTALGFSLILKRARVVAAYSTALVWTAVWLGLIATLGHFGAFTYQPSGGHGPPVGFMGVMVATLFANGWPVLGKNPSSPLISADDLPFYLVCGCQCFRIFVEGMLHWAHVEGFAPKQITWEGNNFDVVTGLAALPVAVYLYFSAEKKDHDGTTRNAAADSTLLVSGNTTTEQSAALMQEVEALGVLGEQEQAAFISPARKKTNLSPVATAVVWTFNVVGITLLLTVITTAVASLPNSPLGRALNVYQHPKELQCVWILHLPFCFLPLFLAQIAFGSHLLIFRKLVMK
ncbi:unnamed protein product [Amoebophrya sp. A120]|nr:unnamed protein product [Amoebophrya sp. A120]|eukprot:GSA120T00000846001.1